jgi:hypothetical protein
VKPNRQPGEKQISFKKQSCLCILYGQETTTTRRSTLFINKGNIQESINKIIKRIFEKIARPLHSQYNFENENSMKRCIF